MQLILIFSSEGLQPSHNLCHSDLFRMERSRITQSYPVITWSTHATHSWFQYRCQQRKKDRERQTSSYCTITAQVRLKLSTSQLWQTGTNTEIKLWVCDYTGTGTAWLDDTLVTVQKTHSWVTTDKWPALSHARDNSAMSHKCYVLLKYAAKWGEHGRYWKPKCCT